MIASEGLGRLPLAVFRACWGGIRIQPPSLATDGERTEARPEPAVT